MIFLFSSEENHITLQTYRLQLDYNLNVNMRQDACLVFNPIMVNNYAAFFNSMPVVGRQIR